MVPLGLSLVSFLAVTLIVDSSSLATEAERVNDLRGSLGEGCKLCNRADAATYVPLLPAAAAMMVVMSGLRCR